MTSGSERDAKLRELAQQQYAAGDLYEADKIMRELTASSATPTAGDLLTCARLALELGETSRAEIIIDGLLAAAPDSPAVVLSATQLYASTGEFSRVSTVLDRALTARPEDASLLELALTYLEDPDEALVRKAGHVADRLPDTAEQKTSLLFPLSRHYDRRGDLDRAWATMLEANDLTRARRGQSARLSATELRVRMQQLAERSIALRRTAPAEDAGGPSPVYLTGAARTGSSLIQTVIAAHNGVASVGERGSLIGPLMNLVQRPDHSTAIDSFRELAKADIAGLARMGHSAGVVVDKTPHTFFVLPLVTRVHGRARAINVVRDPGDVVVSTLFHDFSPAFPEATDPAAIVALLDLRAKLASDYEAADVSVFTVSFDEFLQTPTTIGEDIARYIGIDWDPESLRSERRDSIVKNFSATQVRADIGARQYERWRRYESHLGDVVDMLAPIVKAQHRPVDRETPGP